MAVRTYGEKYMELCRDFIKTQEKYIAELRGHEPRKSNHRRLHMLALECLHKKNIAVAFASHMKERGIRPSEVFEPGNPNL